MVAGLSPPPTQRASGTLQHMGSAPALPGRTRALTYRPHFPQNFCTARIRRLLSVVT